MTREPEKAQHYAFDPLVREGWATLVGVLGAGEAERFAFETALLWVRPDAVAAGAAADVLARVQADGRLRAAAALLDAATDAAWSSALTGYVSPGQRALLRTACCQMA
jgi:hypothetical protein